MEVLGISLQDLTLRESMRKVEQFFRDRKVSTIALITMKGLIAAQDSPEIKSWVDSLDMTVVADADILHAADINYRSRIHDVENGEFIAEFLKKLVRQRKTVYLLSQTESQLKKIEDELTAYEEDLRIVGRLATEELEYDDDFVINDINLKVPDVLISNLESPKRETFLSDNHMKLNVSVWLMVRADRELDKKRKGLVRQVYEKILKKWFRIRLNRYNEQMNQENEENNE